MRRFFYILCLAVLTVVTAPAAAQNTPIGKRIPDVRPHTWLNGVRPSRESRLTCIEFFHPSSKRSMANVANLQSLAARFPRKDFQVVVVASGDAEAVENALLTLTDEGIAVAADTDNACFKAFGVTYLPACVVIDDQKRTVWTGDSKLLTPQLINNLKQK